MTRWEYLSVSWTSSTNFATKGPDEPQTWERAYYMTRPGTARERLPGDLDWNAFLAELGREGWEMVTETVRSSVVLSHSQGWLNVGAPINIVWQFKRPVE